MAQALQELAKDVMAKASYSTVGLSFLVLAIVNVVVKTIYNLYFHPLAKFPGPFLAKVSLLWRAQHTLSGKMHRTETEMHKKYGPVFRVSPNELSFATVEGVKDIYGFPRPGKPPMLKSQFYEMYGTGFDSWCIGSERNPDVHKRMKASLNASFSFKALQEQEYIVAASIDEFIQKVGEKGKTEGAVDMTKWFELIAFDIMGEMSFGESYHAIENEKPHFWTKLILDHLFYVTLADNLRRIEILRRLRTLIMPFINHFRSSHKAYTEDKVDRRLENTSGRKDFFTNIVDKVHSGELRKQELLAHASTFIIAGGESVASALTGTLFHLIHPDSREQYSKLRHEIRSRYASYSEIDFQTVQQLPYMQAVVKEGLRIFPVGFGMPRTSPGTKIGEHWVPAGAEVYASPWTVNHSAQYFTRPYAFEPERWIQDADARAKVGISDARAAEYENDVLDASQPFALGPRACLGRNFANMELSLIIAKLVWKYDMQLVNEKLDFMDESRVHIFWWKPEVNVRVKTVDGAL